MWTPVVMLRCNKNVSSIGLALGLSLCPIAAKADGDALEQFNRSMHEFNQKYYTSSEDGANQFFVDTVPEAVRRGVNNFFANLGEPVIAVSSLAEGDVGNAEVATRRFFYNLVWGYGGFYDQASAAGVNPKHHEMGEITCSYGLPDGPFLELPFYGPATVGDLVGSTLPLVAGYVVLGEAFFFYRASSRVASFMDDKKDDDQSGGDQKRESTSNDNNSRDDGSRAVKAAEADAPAVPDARTNDTKTDDSAKAEPVSYQEAKDRYLAARMAVCRNRLSKATTPTDPAATVR